MPTWIKITPDSDIVHLAPAIQPVFRWEIIQQAEGGAETLIASKNGNEITSADIEALEGGDYFAKLYEQFTPYSGYKNGEGMVIVPFKVKSKDPQMEVADICFGVHTLKPSMEIKWEKVTEKDGNVVIPNDGFVKIGSVTAGEKPISEVRLKATDMVFNGTGKSFEGLYWRVVNNGTTMYSANLKNESIQVIGSIAPYDTGLIQFYDNGTDQNGVFLMVNEKEFVNLRQGQASGKLQWSIEMTP